MANTGRFMKKSTNIQERASDFGPRASDLRLGRQLTHVH